MSGAASNHGQPAQDSCWHLQDPEALLKRVLALQPGWTIVQAALLLSSKLPAGSRVLSDVFGDSEAPHEQQASLITGSEESALAVLQLSRQLTFYHGFL